MKTPLVIYRDFLCISIVFVGLLFALPSYASGKYYANADDPAANDTNSCRTAADACKTLTGAITRILESANPQNSTLVAVGTFTETPAITDTDLEGITITSANEGTRVGIVSSDYYGIYIGNVNNVTIEHLDISNASYISVYVSGDSGNHAEGITIRDVVVHDMVPSTTSYGMYIVNADDVLITESAIQNIGSTTVDTYDYAYAYGMYITSADDLKIVDNTIQDMVISNTNSTATSSIYLSVYGMTISESDRLTVRNNTIRNMISTVNATAAVPSYIYQYGMSISGTTDAVVKDNVIEDIDSILSTTTAGQSVYGNTQGVSVSNAIDTKIARNTIRDSSITVSALAADDAYGTLIGLTISGLRAVGISRNTINNNTITTTSGATSDAMVGMAVSDVEDATIHHNTIREISANQNGDGSASTIALRLTDTPSVMVYRNRMFDFTAASVTAQSNSSGVAVGYNSSADIFNNYIYFTTPSTQSNIDGIQVLSSQANPVRIYHNTLYNLLTCLDVDYAATVKFMNNVCSMGNGGGYGVEVSTDRYTMDVLESNRNSFYNSVAPMAFNDTDQGLLTYGDWKSGIYLQDKKSLNKNPQLNTDNSNSANYLHLKKKSPLVNAGKMIVVKNDEKVQQNLLFDWDNNKRPVGKAPDIGADEQPKKKKK